MTKSGRNQSRRASPRPAIQRLTVVALLGILVGIATSFFGAWQGAVLVGWDAAALGFIVWIWLAVWEMDSDATRRHAQLEDPSRVLANSVVTVAAVASLAAVGLILIKADNAKGDPKAFFLIVGLLSLALGWGTLHSTFTLRYAATYYSSPVGGVDFNQKEPPRYSDFAYLAFTLGMTYQVSDTDLTTEAIRRLALRHALLSFLFGVVILGFVVNMVASLLH
jgi:uncharacterized membrane protein